MSRTRTVRHLSGFLIATAIAATPIVVSAAETEAKDRGPANAVGYEIDLDALPSPHPRPTPLPAAPAGEGPGTAPSPLYVEVGIPWAQVEKTPGQYDWSVADEIILSHAQAGYAVVLHPRGDNPLYPGLSARDQKAVEGWTGFLRALAVRYKDPTDLYALGAGFQDLDARDWAYLIKVSTVMIRSADPGAKILLWGLEPSRAGAAEYLDALYGEGVAAYVDDVAVTGATGDLTAIKVSMQRQDAGAKLWVTDVAVPGDAAASGRLLRGYLNGVGEEAAVTLFRIDFDQEGAPFLLPVLERIRARFLPGYTPLVESGRGIQVTNSMGQPVSVKTLRLFDADLKKALIAYDGGEGTVRGTQAVLSIDTVDLSDPTLQDIAAGESATLGAWQKDEKAGLTRAAVPLADYPLVLEYRRFTTPLYSESEKLQITEKRLPSVEEVLAHYQAVQKAQDELLRNMRADARVDYHFRMGTGSSIDINVTVLNSFFLDPNVGGEFEQKEFFVNGVKWRSDRMPELPLPQPEKVMTLPLDITLDKRYSYRLTGDEKVGEYDCWVVDFDPIESAGSLYKGRVWIDKTTFERVQISSVQTGLKPPIISNDEKDSYRPVRGPDGLDYWLLSRIDGQQVFSTAGRNLVLVREVAFSNHVINDTAFEDLHKQAYASPHQILRDTPSGQRYLEPTPDGGRAVREKPDPDNLFLVGGTYYHRALDFPLPLAGVNYFNRDLGGRGIQTNVFFAGVLLFGNLSDPHLFGRKIDGSVDLFATGFSTTDTPVVHGREDERRSVDVTEQSVTLGLGVPFADYWKVKLTGDLSFDGFAHDKALDPNVPAFTVPVDTLVETAGLEGEFNRKAWNVIASIESSRRADWECWGRHCSSATPRMLEAFDDARSYIRYEAAASKDFFLPLNQKIHVGARFYGGSDLDRFSEYRFSFFGNRLRGFGGAGYTYSDGLKEQIQYAFNLGSVIRFDASIDHASVRDRMADDPRHRSFTGFGLSGQTIVGPNLIVSLDWGIAVASSIEQYRGDQEILLTVLRLFR